MNKTKKYMVLDVETANSVEDPFVYDIGFLICDRYGNIYEKKSFVVTDIYDGEKDLMTSCYYAKKLPRYEEGLRCGNFQRISFYSVRQLIKFYLEKYHVSAVCAYNARFDCGALNLTQRFLTCSKYRYFFPYGTQIYDVWNMACQMICKRKKYYDYCVEMKKISPKGNILTNAETVYGFITKDCEFSESHTGLEDVMIETQIMAYCFRQKKPMNKKINRWCWRIPQKKKEKIEKMG